MRSLIGKICIAAAIMIGMTGIAQAQMKGKHDIGKREYTNSCALCHGADGKGGGAIVDLLKKSPTDLSTLSRKNGGVFPVQRVYMVIDGREQVAVHGERDMPIWGRRFAVEDAPAHDEYPFDAEALVRSRILALIDYLNRLQVK